MKKILNFKGVACYDTAGIEQVYKDGLCNKEEFDLALRQFESIGISSIFAQEAEVVYEEFSPKLFTNRNVSKIN